MVRTLRTAFFRRKPTLRFIVFVLLALLGGWRLHGPLIHPPPAPLEQGAVARVERVVDGDTLLLTTGQRVRLLGVDTPETKDPHRPVEPFGPEASEFTRQHVEGRQVRLQFDRERQDRYHRVLAYVYVDDWFLNEELILAGFSRAETRFSYSEAMKRRFKKAEQIARQNKAGLWSDPSFPAERPPRGVQHQSPR